MAWVPIAEVPGSILPPRNRSFHQTFDAIPALEPMYASWEKSFDVLPGLNLAIEHEMAGVYAAAAYLVGIWALRRYMAERKALNITPLVAAWDFFLSLFSIVGLVRTLPHVLYNFSQFSFHENICGNAFEMYGGGSCGLWVQLFIFSKFAELLDTVLIILKKRKLIFLHWYHHAATLMFCWHAYGAEASIGIFFATMNYGVHSLMYGYYGLMALKAVPKWFPTPVITALQILQMFAGIFICAAAGFYVYQGRSCDTKATTLYWAGVMYLSYAALFVKFAVDRFLRPKPKPAAQHTKGTKAL